MIIDKESDLTDAVLAEMVRIEAPRLRQIMTLAVRHLHAFVREAQLTEAEFQQACATIARLGQMTNASHNEVVLAAGSLGISSLVCLLNNGDQGRRETTANLLGPFWREGAPLTPDGGSIVRSPTPGAPLFVTGRVCDLQGQAVAGAQVDVWHSSSEGYYENQDPEQADMNLRGRFVTDAEGRFRLRTIKPVGYPIPVGGPVGSLVKAAGRHNMRPAHLHFMICKEGFKTQFSQVYASDDPNLDSDVQFAVTRRLIGQMQVHEHEAAPAPDVQGPWHSLAFEFVIEAGVSTLPRPPITGKSESPRPSLDILERR